MRFKFDWTGLIGSGALLVTGIATLIINWAEEQKMEQMIDEKIKEALAKKEES